MPDPALLALLAAAAAAGGALNAVAGGGSFFTFPALLLVGIHPIVANATSAVALWPASIASAAAYREDLQHERRTLLRFGAVSLAGGLGGALLLLLTPEQAFAALVPWLLLAATVIFAFGPYVTQRLRARDMHAPMLAVLGVHLAVATYGGYFGGGMGILMLAAFSALGMESIHAMNGLKAILGTVINGVAIAAFIVAGIVAWPYALGMTAASIAGGWFGARYARKVRPQHVRAFVIAVGALLTAYFFVN